jgi:hypothetical protein
MPPGSRERFDDRRVAPPDRYKWFPVVRTDVPRDRSLDEFVADEDTGREDDTSDRAETTSDDAEGVESDPVQDVESASATFEWSPDGNACGSCDRVVSRLWRGDAGLVCRDCKEW